MNDPPRKLPVIAGLLVLAVILLGLALDMDGVAAADHRIAEALAFRAGGSSPAIIAFMQGISWIGGGVPRWGAVALLALLVWRWWRRGRRPALLLAGASLFASLASSALKAAFDRARPDLIAHLDAVSNASYPSGHATNAAVLYLLFAWLAPPRWRALCWALAGAMILLTCLSRVMLGVHWPSDIIGGTMLGTAFALLGAWRIGTPIRSAGRSLPPASPA